MIEDLITKVIKNPAIINWDYFLKYGFNWESDIHGQQQDILTSINAVMPEDSISYKQLLDVVTKLTDNNEITYDFIVKVLCKFIVSVRSDQYEYIHSSNMLYNSTSYIIPIVASIGNDLSSLNLSDRAYNCLKRYGCNTVDDVIAVIKENKLHEVRNLGENCTKEVIGAVEKWKEVNKWSDK